MWSRPAVFYMTFARAAIGWLSFDPDGSIGADAGWCVPDLYLPAGHGKPTELWKEATMSTQQLYTLFETEIGWIGIAWSDAGLTRLQLPERSATATERRLLAAMAGSSPQRLAGEPPAGIAELIEELRRYAAGEPVDSATRRSISPASTHSAVKFMTRRAGSASATPPPMAVSPRPRAMKGLHAKPARRSAEIRSRSSSRATA
jgi:hypothetical protein